MTYRRFLLNIVSALFILSTPLFGGPVETRLDSWSFSFDGKTWTDVHVPHSWNARDGHSPSYFRGKGYYRTSLNFDGAPGPCFIRFEGAAQEAEVFVNGKPLAFHSGGYTPFTVPLSGVIKAGENVVEVVCDNSENLARIPVTSDFNKNGGLHNPVSLLQLPAVYLDPSEYGFDRFHLVQKKVTREKASCELRTRLCNSTLEDATVKLTITVRDASGETVRKTETKVLVPAGGHTDFARTVEIRKPHLWNGKKDPYLYTVCLQAGEDYASGKTGLRYYRLDREKGFFLNGESYPLRGVSMHQDRDGKASALDKEDYDTDYAMVKEIGCNFLRLAHYPHNNYAFRLCDSLGIVVQTEIPWVNVCGVRASEAYFQNIHDQMREMIVSLYNHPP